MMRMRRYCCCCRSLGASSYAVARWRHCPQQQQRPSAPGERAAGKKGYPPLRHLLTAPALPLLRGTGRFYSTGQAPQRVGEDDDGGGDDDEMEDDLDAYENLLLNADEALQDGAAEGDAKDSSGDDGGAAATFVDHALALLPRDGRSVRLTEMTPSLDVETISETYGSVLQMLQQHTTAFVCVQVREADGPPRWHVRRRAAVPGAAGELHNNVSPTMTHPAPTASDLADMLLAEELRAVGLVPSGIGRSPGRLPRSTNASRRREGSRQRQLVSITDAGTTGRTEASLALVPWAAVAEMLPANGGGRAVQAVRADAAFPAAARAALASSGKGLVRLFHEQYAVASAYVELSLDGVYMARRSGLGRGVALWTPERAAASAGEGKDLEDAGWVGELSLDDNGGEHELPTSGAKHEWEEDEEEVRGSDRPDGVAAEAVEVYYDGLPNAVPFPFFRPRRPGEPGSSGGPRHRPPPPKPKKKTTVAIAAPDKRATAPVATTPPPSATPRPPRGTEPQPKRRRLTPEELMAAHTALAEQRGWRSPAEMLDLLVECVPTFYVPLSAIVASDSLAKVLGPRNSMQHVVRVYSYFFERDRAADRVRLRPDLTHPQRGKADGYYAAHAASTATQDGLHGGEAAALRTAEVPSPPSSSHLQSSATTRAFPVLRPIIRSAIDVGVGGMRARRGKGAAVPSTKPGSGEAPMMVGGLDAAAAAGGGATGSLTKVPQAPAFPSNPFNILSSSSPYREGEKPHGELWPSLPLFFALLSSLSHEEHTTLAAAAATIASTVLGSRDMSDMVGEALQSLRHGVATPSSPRTEPPLAAFLAWARAYELFLFKGDDATSLSLRLRPFWLAPGATGEAGTEALPAECVKLLQPIWKPLSLLLDGPATGGRLSPKDREEMHRRAQAAGGGGSASASDVVAYLRSCGRAVWVNAAGTHVRRFTATEDLDDLVHVLIPCLSHFASPVDFEAIAVVAQRAARGIQAAAGLPETSPETGEVGLFRFLREADPVLVRDFLQRHPKSLEVKMLKGEVSLRRKTHFAAFGGKT